MSISALPWSPDELCRPWPIDFQSAFERLEALPRMFIELDGSLVWVGETADGQRWQLDGLLNDSPQGLMTMELKGAIPLATWFEFRRLLIDDATQLAFQLVREGVYVSEPEFCRLFLD